jgi:hypothetical protein
MCRLAVYFLECRDTEWEGTEVKEMGVYSLDYGAVHLVTACFVQRSHRLPKKSDIIFLLQKHSF